LLSHRRKVEFEIRFEPLTSRYFHVFSNNAALNGEAPTRVRGGFWQTPLDEIAPA